MVNLPIRLVRNIAIISCHYKVLCVIYCSNWTAASMLRDGSWN